MAKLIIENSDVVHPHAEHKFIVRKPFDATVMGSSSPSNYYYGSSRIHTRSQSKHTIQPGDHVYHWPGGTFHVTKDAKGAKVGTHMHFSEPSEKSPFEKSYGMSSTELNGRAIHRLLQSGHLEHNPAATEDIRINHG